MVIKKWLQSLGGDNAETPRHLERIDDLQINDYVRLGLDSRPELSEQEFTVRDIHGLDFRAGKADDRTVFALDSGQPRLVYLWRHALSGDDALAFAYEASEDEVVSTLDMSAFPKLFETGRQYLLNVAATAEGNPWIADLYREEVAQEAYYLQLDPRADGAGDTLGPNQQAMDFYRLVSPDRKAAIEVLVFDGGRTQVHFINYLPVFKIDELLPSA